MKSKGNFSYELLWKKKSNPLLQKKLQIITIYLKYCIYKVKKISPRKKNIPSQKVRVSNDFSTNIVQHCTKLLHVVLPVSPEG